MEPKLIEQQQDRDDRDEKMAGAVWELLRQVPMRGTFEEIEEMAAQVREIREWLAEFRP